MDRYPAPASFQRSEREVKRSRFITSIDHVNNKAQAKAFIAKLRQQYPDANHHCWAMIAGAPDDLYQQDQSDDGEPKGTAGKPMLNVLQHAALGNIIVVVTRYFGGIRLGAGGLVRAYTRAVSEPLKTLDTQLVVIKQPVGIEVPYAELAGFEHWLQSTDIDVSEKSFTDSVALTLQVPAEERQQLIGKLKILGGQLKTTD